MSRSGVRSGHPESERNRSGFLRQRCGMSSDAGCLLRRKTEFARGWRCGSVAPEAQIESFPEVGAKGLPDEGNRVQRLKDLRSFSKSPSKIALGKDRVYSSICSPSTSHNVPAAEILMCAPGTAQAQWGSPTKPV